MNYYETKKLYYGKYLYKLVIYNTLAPIFRSELQRKGDLSFARQQLDRLHADYENNIPLKRTIFRTGVPVSKVDFFDAKEVYNQLKTKTDQVCIRIGTYRNLVLYSNNKQLLCNLMSQVATNEIDFWQPASENVDFLCNNKHIVIVDNKPAYNIRVILGKKRGADGLATWLANNKDKSKVGNITYQALQEQTYVNGLYFYVRDEKVLQLITLICGDNIRKIERLVWHEEIDKYKYGNE